MPDYEKLYHVLFNKVSHVIQDLQTIQQVAEEIYIATDEQTDEDTLNILIRLLKKQESTG